MIEGWDGAHCLAFLEAPHFDVKHLEIGQETKKLGPLHPKCHEFESRTWQLSLKFFYRLGFRGSGLLSKIFFVFRFDPFQGCFWPVYKSPVYKTNIYLKTSFRKILVFNLSVYTVYNVVRSQDFSMGQGSGGRVYLVKFFSFLNSTPGTRFFDLG